MKNTAATTRATGIAVIAVDRPSASDSTPVTLVLRIECVP
jgi:hypothetical protein